MRRKRKRRSNAASGRAQAAGAPVWPASQRGAVGLVGLLLLLRSAGVARSAANVDPSWIEGGARTQYARGLDGCVLALDVREKP